MGDQLAQRRQRARPGAVRGGNGGAGTAPEPGCRLSEITTITNRLITANRRSSRRPDPVLRLSSHPSLATIRWRAGGSEGTWAGGNEEETAHSSRAPCARTRVTICLHPVGVGPVIIPILQMRRLRHRAGPGKPSSQQKVQCSGRLFPGFSLSQWRGDPAGACLAGERQGRGPAARRGCGPSCHDRRRGEDCQPRRKRRRCLDKHGHVSTKRALEFKTLRQRWLAGLPKSWGTLSACACSQGPQRPQLCP
ncbi:uncharacterized protein LOC117197288 [Orcinus orca]|uniref:uncharacterized protein LOC117197288 n=1 Tax=Orcinus orca TaxID=9733 RepID=UPI0014416D8F|nr:uncharacterized protein LOC117197288 [Orcinus orca]